MNSAQEGKQSSENSDNSVLEIGSENKSKTNWSVSLQREGADLSGRLESLEEKRMTARTTEAATTAAAMETEEFRSESEG